MFESRQIDQFKDCMKLDYENTFKIKQWFKINNRQTSCDDETVFEIYKTLQYYGSITHSKSISGREEVIKKQMDFIRKSIVNIMYEENNESAKGLKCGYVYAISNPAWKDYIKVGAAIDVYDRLNSYQTSSPMRDFELVSYVYSKDRLGLESKIHSKFERNGEWVKTDKKSITSLLKSFNSYPEKEIAEFAIIETLRVVCNEPGESVRTRISVAIRGYCGKIAEYAGVDKNSLYVQASKSSSYISKANCVVFTPLNLKFTVNKDNKIDIVL